MTSWQETSPGRFERPCDSIERFFLALVRGATSVSREPSSLNIVARLEMGACIEDIQVELKHAWKTMRYDHPQIACIACGDTIVYEVPDTAALDAWLRETFIIAPASTTKEELLGSFRASALATLHYLPHTSEIIIHTSHWRIDYIGGLSLLHNLLVACIEPRHTQFGDEQKNLSPSRDKAAQSGSPDTLESPAIIEERAKAIMDLLTPLANLPSTGLLTRNPRQPPGRTLRSEMTLEASTTSAIISASKKRGLTVTAAVHAALVVATQQLAPTRPSAFSIYTTWGVFNIRPQLQAPYNNPILYPAGPQVISFPVALHTSIYTHLAVQLQDFYKHPMPSPAGNRVREDIVVPYNNRLTDLASKPPVDLPPSTEPMLQSIGVVDGYLQRNYGDMFELKDFWIAPEEMTPRIQCYLWTWHGKMTLSAFYNETFYEGEFVQDFLKRSLDVLYGELEIQGA